MNPLNALNPLSTCSEWGKFPKRQSTRLDAARCAQLIEKCSSHWTVTEYGQYPEYGKPFLIFCTYSTDSRLWAIWFTLATHYWRACVSLSALPPIMPPSRWKGKNTQRSKCTDPDVISTFLSFQPAARSTQGGDELNWIEPHFRCVAFPKLANFTLQWIKLHINYSFFCCSLLSI